MPGVQQASVMMGTPSNRKLLDEAGLLLEAAEQAGPNDLIIAIQADSDVALQVAAGLTESLLRSREVTTGAARERRPRSIVSAAAQHPEATLLLVSTPGPVRRGGDERPSSRSERVHVQR